MPVRDVVSKNFAGYDQWIHPGSRTLCQPCAWSYALACGRKHAHLVDDRAFGCLGHDEVREHLLQGALPSRTALIVPLRRGRRYLLAEAQWGRVVTDDGPLPWTAVDADRLAAVTRLRTAGFGTQMLRASAPAYAVLRQRPSSTWAQVMADWADLTPWRSPPSPWFALALFVTGTPKEELP